MARVLIVFATIEGQTEKVAEAMATELKRMGHSVRLRDVKQLRRPGPLGRYDGVIVGGPVHASGYPVVLKDWAREHAEELGRRPGAFFRYAWGFSKKTT
jgi:menaquinone-dependent protoporphyrinogen oxidase